MPTKLEIINNALRLVGEPRISALTGTPAQQPRAVAALEEWPHALEELLREHPWHWAMILAELDQASPTPTFGWAYRYALPSNFLTMHKLNGIEVRGQAGDWWELFPDYLHTDADTASVQFVARPNDGSPLGNAFTTTTLLANMDPKAANALAALLASKLASPTTKDGVALSDRLLSRYGVLLASAITRTANEAKRPWRDPASESRFITARRYGPRG